MPHVKGSPRRIGDFIGRLLTSSRTFDKHLELQANLPSVAGAAGRGVGPYNILILFGQVSESSFWFAGLDFSGELSDSYGMGLVIGRYLNGLAHVETHLSLGEEAASLITGLNDEYFLQLDINRSGTTVELDLSCDTDPDWALHAETTTDYLRDGKVGYGAYGTGINIQYFGYGYCLTSEGSSDAP